MPAMRRASATTAIRLPRRWAICSAHRVVLCERDEACIRGRDLCVERRPYRDERGEFREHVRRQWQCEELGDRVLGVPARNAQAFAPDERLDDRHVPGAGPHERIADDELRAEMALGIARPVDGSVRAELQRLAQCASIALVGLDPLRPRGIHRREARIGDDHRVAERFEMAGDLLALRRRLEQNPRGPPRPEGRSEPLPARSDPSLEQFPVLRHDAELALALVEINPYAIHGWHPG
jgi:hypothetical protein